MVDLRLRLFIPSRAIAVPMGPLSTGFDGDHRGFSYDGGTSRAEIWVEVDHSPFAPQIIASVKRKAFGQTARYSIDKIVDVPGKPFWWKEIRRQPFLNVEMAPDAVATAEVTPDTLSVSGSIVTDAFGLSSFASVKLHVLGKNPLEPLAPPFNCDLDIRIARTGLPGYSYSIIGSHDGFPAYECYLDNRLVYSHDPVAFGSTPLSLFEEGGISVNVPLSLMW
jgi:hypothetical protein